MQTVTTKAIAKVAAVATGLAMFAAVAVGPASASAAALTSSQVSAIVSLLQSFGADSSTIANVQASLTGGTPSTTTTTTAPSTSSSCSFTKDLTIGSTGTQVTCLQNALKAAGYMTTNATGYFGALTKTAVIKWQTAAGVTPASGYFGAKSRAAFGGSSSSSTTTTTTTTTTTPTSTAYTGGGNGLKISLSPTSPNGTVLVQKQGIGDLGDFVFANPTASPINVTALTFNRTGVSNDATLVNVYLYNAGTRITDSAGVNNSTFSFTNSAGLFTVPAGMTYTVSVRSDIADQTSGQQIGVSLVSATSSGTLDSSVSFPILSGYQTISAASLATVSFNATTLPNGSSLTLSPQNDYPVWQNTISVSTNPVKLSSMRFTNLGSITASNMLNLRLYVDGTQVGSAVPQLGADRTVTFDLSAAPVLLSTQSHVIKVLANVVGGASLTFALSIQRSSDAMFVDNQLNQPVTPVSNGSSTNFSAVTASTVTLNAVSASSGVSATKDPASAINDVSVGATGVDLATFDMLPSGENVKVMDLYVCATTAGTNSGTGLNNGKIYLNGVQVGSTHDLVECGSTSAYTDFSMGSSLILPAGITSKVDVYADAQNAAGTNIGSGGTAQITIKKVAANAQGVDSLMSTAVPGADTSGNAVTVTASALTASKASGYANQTLLSGTTGALLGSFTLSAGSTEALAVNTIELDLAGYAGVTNLHLVDDATQSSANLGTTISSPAAQNNAFSVNFTLPVSGTKTIDIYGSILSSATDPIIATLDTTTGATGVSSGSTATLAGTSVLQTITVGAGKLYATRSANNPLSTNVLANSSGVKVAAFTFSAVNSPFTVQKLAVKIPANAATAVTNVMLTYKDKNGTSQTATQSLQLSSGTQPYATATFTGLSFYVPAGSSSDLAVSVSTPSIASGSASISGAAISALIDNVIGFQAIDASGSATTTPAFISVDNLTGASGSYGTSVLRESIPTFAGVSLSDSTPVNAGTDLYKFTVSADPSGTVDLYKITLNVATSSTNAAGPLVRNFYLYDTADMSNALNSSIGAVASAADCSAGCNVTFTLDAPSAHYVAIAAGTTKTFVLRATSVGTWAISSGITTRFATVDSTAEPNAVAGSVVGPPLYVWSDESANNHSVSSSDWTNGYLLKDLSDGVYSYQSTL